MSISDNLKRVNERIVTAARRAGRDPSEVTVVAVTKTFGPEVVESVVGAGVMDVGENRIQEFLEKAGKVRMECRWHLVGHLQTNKVNKALGRFELIHSVDSLKLASRLSRAGAEAGMVSDVLLQVNTSGEDSKFGLGPGEVLETCGAIAEMDGIKVRGLMTIAPWVDDVKEVAGAFARLRRLREEIESADIKGIFMEHLSMGMTDDFEVAIAEGSTMVRLGRVILGERG